MLSQKTFLILQLSTLVTMKHQHQKKIVLQYFLYLKHHCIYKSQSTARIIFVLSYSAKKNMNQFFNALAHLYFPLNISIMSQIGYIFSKLSAISS